MSSIEAVGVTESLEEQDVEYLGHVCWATTGDVIVPREWLVERFEEVPRGEALIPNETWPSSAYKLACQHLVKSGNRKKDIDGYQVELRVEKGDSGNYRHLLGDVLIPQSECGEEGGRINSVKLSTYRYDADKASPVITHMVDEDSELFEEAVVRGNKLMKLWRQMKESHYGQDLRQVFTDLRDEETNAIPLRHAGAVYFFPVQYSDTVESLADVWEDMNQFKEDGHEMEIATIPLIDNEGHRNMVERHAERMIQKRIDDVVEAGIDRLSQDDGETAQEIAEKVVGELEESLDMAQEYSALLDTKLTVKRHIQDWVSEVEADKEEMVREILESDEVEL